MKSAIQLLSVAAAMLLLSGGFVVWRHSSKPPRVRLPSQKISQFPLHIDNWVGEDKELDAQLFSQIGAEDVVNRYYHDREGHAVSMHMAMFVDMDAGVYHSPTNCYQSNGYRLIELSKVPLPIDGDISPLTVSASTWEKEKTGEKKYVLFWYQLEEKFLYERFDLGMVRWQMRGRQTWPPLYKVLLETSAADGPAGKARLFEIAKIARLWLNEAQAASDTEPASKP